MDGSNQTIIRRTNTRVTGASYTRDATSAPSRRKRTKAWFRLSAVNRLQRARASVPRRRSANRTYLFFLCVWVCFFLNESKRNTPRTKVYERTRHRSFRGGEADEEKNLSVPSDFLVTIKLVNLVNLRLGLFVCLFARVFSQSYSQRRRALTRVMLKSRHSSLEKLTTSLKPIFFDFLT